MRIQRCPPALIPLGLLLLLTRPVAANVILPNGPIRRAAEVVRIWPETHDIVYGECIESGTAQAPARVVVKAVARGALREGETIQVPGLDTFELTPPIRVPCFLTLEKGSSYILYLRDEGGRKTLLPRPPFIGFTTTCIDGTVILPGGACRIPGKPEASEMWRTLTTLGRLEKGTLEEQVEAVRLLVRSDWVRQTDCRPETLRAIEALDRSEDPVAAGVVLSLLREDLPLLRRRDPGMDALAQRLNVAGKDPWEWSAEADERLRVAYAEFTTEAKAGPAAERAAATRLLEAMRSSRRPREGGHKMQAIWTPILRDEFCRALRDATRDPIDWPMALALLGQVPPQDSLSGADVAALVRLVRSPEFGGGLGEASLGALFRLERLTNGALKGHPEQRDPGREGLAWGKWWDETGSHDPRYREAVPK